VVALYKLALDWSLNGMILGRAVELSKGASLFDDRMDQKVLSGINYIVLIFWFQETKHITKPIFSSPGSICTNYMNDMNSLIDVT